MISYETSRGFQLLFNVIIFRNVFLLPITMVIVDLIKLSGIVVCFGKKFQFLDLNKIYFVSFKLCRQIE